MTCVRHPGVAAQGGHCGACLLEIALAAPSEDGAGLDSLEILLPLGSTDDTVVFLARDRWRGGRLVRLKAWRRAVSEDLLADVLDLHQRITALALPATSSSLEAGFDAHGHLYVVSEFRQGVPISSAAASLTAEVVSIAARTCSTTLEALHGAGIVHGAVHGGNVLVHPATSAVTLLDTGMRPLLAGVAGASAEDDRRALAQLMQRLGFSGA